MDHRDQLHGKTIQDSGLNQRHRFPVAGLPGFQSVEPPSMAMMEHMAALHDADTQNMLIRNQQLLEGHQTLRQDLDNTEKEIRKIRGNLGGVEALSGLHMSELVGNIRKLEAEICAGAAVKKELLEVHLEADKLRAEKQELSVKLQELTAEICAGAAVKKELLEVHLEADKLRAEKQELSVKLQELTAEICAGAAVKKELLAVHLEAAKLRAEKQELSVKLQELTDRIKIIEKCCDGKACFPELHGELDRLQEENQCVRAILQYSRDINTKQVEQMETMEMIFKALTEQIDKLCVELQDAEMRTQELATVVQAIADESGIAETQTMPAGIGPHGSANNNLHSTYHQETQEGQFGVAQAPSASAAVYPEGWLYGYTVPDADTNLMVYLLPVQVSGYAGYPDANYDQNVIFCPVYTAYYDQNALDYYPIANAAPQDTVTVNGVPATDAANMDGNAGPPSWQDQTDGETTTSLAETPETPSDTIYLVSLTPTEEALM